MAKRIVHYLNQFYAGIGGEDQADVTPSSYDKVMGPGMALKTALGADFEIVGTVVCGDNYVNSNSEAAIPEILGMIKAFEPDAVIAGPAFNAGRYGYACANVALAVKEELGIPVLTGMYTENPGADFKDKILIVPTANSAAGMRKGAPMMAALGLKLMKGEKLGASCEDNYMPNGVRVNFFEKERGAKRAVKMLLNKINGKPFTTEFPMPNFDRVEPGKAIPDMSKVVLGLATSGGTVPKGNPDRIEASNASKYGEYDIEGLDTLTAEGWETAHGGYDPVYANEDPNRVLPVDVLRQMEKEGKIGKLHRYFYTTVGNGTAVASSRKFAEEYAKKMLQDGVQACIMTST